MGYIWGIYASRENFENVIRTLIYIYILIKFDIKNDRCHIEIMML